MNEYTTGRVRVEMVNEEAVCQLLHIEHERDRWENEGGNPWFTRNTSESRLDLYESDFLDIEQIQLDRPVE